ncbi:MAG: dihydrofolate reductase family protein [Bacteroidetes bacterium]|nr:dihydrofolate reductase family protein [Bacteroidota bacterium]
MQNQRKLVLYIAMSLDGYIATKGDDLSFLSVVEKEGEDYGYQAFTDTVDTVILGRKTYDKVMTLVDTFPHVDKETYVITRTPKPSAGKIQFYSGDLKDLVFGLKNKPGRLIFCDGGAELVTELLKLDLIDELIISVIPVLLGDGISLFNPGRPERKLKLLSSKAYESGLVQVHYVKM